MISRKLTLSSVKALIGNMSGEARRPGTHIGLLLVILAGLSLSILALDAFLWEVAFLLRVVPLGIFIVIHIVLASLIFTKRVNYKPILIWAALLFVLGAADVSQAPIFYEGEQEFAAFANYLFNPLDPSGRSVGNPPGIPAVPLDLMMIIYLVIVGLSIKGLKSSKKESPKK